MVNAPGRFEVGLQVWDRGVGADISGCAVDLAGARRSLDRDLDRGFDRGQVPAAPHGFAELAQWLEGQLAVDRAADARKELAIRGLSL